MQLFVKVKGTSIELLFYYSYERRRSMRKTGQDFRVVELNHVVMEKKVHYFHNDWKMAREMLKESFEKLILVQNLTGRRE